MLTTFCENDPGRGSQGLALVIKKRRPRREKSIQGEVELRLGAKPWCHTLRIRGHSFPSAIRPRVAISWDEGAARQDGGVAEELCSGAVLDCYKSWAYAHGRGYETKRTNVRSSKGKSRVKGRARDMENGVAYGHATRVSCWLISIPV